MPPIVRRMLRATNTTDFVRWAETHV
jgi:hypothetical protein